MATLKLNKKTAGPPGSSNKRNADGERRAPIRGKGVSRPRQSLEAAKTEREQRQAQFEQRRGEQDRPGRPPERASFDRPRGDRPAPQGGGYQGGPGRGGPGQQRPPARDGWRNEGPRFESRHEGRNEGRGDGRGEGRNEGQRFDPRGGPQGRPDYRDQRDPRDSRDSRPQGSGGGGGYGRDEQRPRFDDRRPAYGQGQGQQRPQSGGYNPAQQQRHPSERGGPGPREDRWQGQRPSYAQEPRRDGDFGGGREANREGYREPRQDQRRASGPRPGFGQGSRPDGQQNSQQYGQQYGQQNSRPNAAQHRAGEQLPAHLREAAAKLRRQLDEGDDGDDRDDVFIDANSEGLRLSKHMGVLGLASRREADEWIAAGWVRVDGKLAVLGQRVAPDVKIEIDPLAHKEQAKRVTILLHKPIGYVSGQAEDGYEPASVLVKTDTHWTEDSSGIKYHIGHTRGLAPAGRLDIDSTGLLVLTQDGRIAKLLIGEDSSIEKEYLVRVEYQGRDGVKSEDGRLPAEDLALLNHGLELDGVKLKPAKVSWQNEDQLRFVLREGRKRQIRRMCEQVGLKVVGLKRVRIGRINLGNLPVGQWRFLTPWERFD
ncbi:pseudouridine synthase [Paucibacter sp. DJ1R-11]|uniref:pseudouridine synthase n=1 Tax=Paucibacter sp. DJ1R-11 TaxID=2893556 RepID=UPI0021E394A7|nr:pseudouridine synthase [Paucibacter sp. DJ1R-11]MCV2364362.1 pseudouridine synthase [Paucibacter sp. DJ1R-11]